MLDTYESTLPEGEVYLQVLSPTAQVYLDIKTYYSPCLTSTLISENIIITDTKSKGKSLSYQTIKKHLPTAISKGYMNITCHYQKIRARDIVLHGILINRGSTPIFWIFLTCPKNKIKCL